MAAAQPTAASLRIDDAQARRLLAGLEIAAGDPGELHELLAAQVEFDTLRRFETESGPDGSPWPPSLRALAESGQTLTDTARLRQSIVSRADRRGFEVGTNLVYAAIHQFGGTIRQPERQQTMYWHQKAGEIADWRFVKKRKANYSETHTVAAHDVTMPARPYLGVSEGDVRVLGEIAAHWLAGAMGLRAAS